MLVLNYQQDLFEFKEAVSQYCTIRIDYLEGDECSIDESVEGFDEVDFLENLHFFIERDGKVQSKPNTLVERVIREARIHSMEAKIHRSTVHEIYQFLGIQKGDWNGATPVIGWAVKLEAELAVLKEEVAELKHEAGSW